MSGKTNHFFFITRAVTWTVTQETKGPEFMWSWGTWTWWEGSCVYVWVSIIHTGWVRTFKDYVDCHIHVNTLVSRRMETETVEFNCLSSMIVHYETIKVFYYETINGRSKRKNRDRDQGHWCKGCWRIYTNVSVGFVLILIDKTRDKEKTYICVSVWWKTKS